MSMDTTTTTASTTSSTSTIPIEEEEAALLEELPPELVVMVASPLDLTSTLALASSSPILSSVLTSTVEWAATLAKMARVERARHQGSVTIRAAELRAMLAEHREQARREQEVQARNEEEVEEIAEFLRTIKEPEELVEQLLHHICTEYSDTRNSVTLSCSLHHHQVSLPGLHLLHLATSSLSATPWPVVEVAMAKCPEVAHLATLVEWVEEQEEEVASLQVDDMRCRTREDLLAATDLLGACGAWQVGSLMVQLEEEEWEEVMEMEEEEEVGEFWSRLAVVMKRGRVKKVVTEKEMMAVGSVEALRKVWEATELDWLVMADEWFVKRRVVRRRGEVERVEEGWLEVLQVLEEVEESEEELDENEDNEQELDEDEGKEMEDVEDVEEVEEDEEDEEAEESKGLGLLDLGLASCILGYLAGTLATFLAAA